jgi:hypothetical protein
MGAATTTEEAKPDMAAAEEDVAVDEELASAEEASAETGEDKVMLAVCPVPYSFANGRVAKLLCDACLFLLVKREFVCWNAMIEVGVQVSIISECRVSESYVAEWTLNII